MNDVGYLHVKVAKFQQIWPHWDLNFLTLMRIFTLLLISVNVGVSMKQEGMGGVGAGTRKGSLSPL